MRKILVAAAVSVIAMAYVAAPDAVAGAIGGTGRLGVVIGRTILDVVTLGAGGGTGAPAGQTGGSVVELEDGTRVWVPADAELAPADGQP
jgi:opacity protein-like surface antigen